MKIVCVVQARLNSTRLPRKVLLQLAGKTMLWNMLERVKRSVKLDEVVCAVPADDAYVLMHAIPPGVFLAQIEGDENDLVMRHLAAAESRKADIVVRLPSDNAMPDPAFIDDAIDSYLTELHPFYSNTTAWCGAQYVDGIGCEVISISRLKWLDKRTQGHTDWREHPHKWFVDSGVVKLPTADVRLEVNTQADYDFIASIYNHFQHNRFTTAEVLDYLYAAQSR